MTSTHTQEDLLNIVNTWYESNRKLDKYEDLVLMKTYLKSLEHISNKIVYSNDYEFVYYDYPTAINIRKETIFKLNWRHIVKVLNRYFPDVKVSIRYEVPSDMLLKLKKDKCYFRHDVYIFVRKRHDDNVYDYALEYFEKNSHKDINKDEDKKIITSQIVDMYNVYKEENNNMYDFMKKCIYNLLMLICTALNDHYSLSKIIFFKNYQYDSAFLKKFTDTYNLIVSYKKQQSFDIQYMIKLLGIKDPNTNKIFKVNDFIDYFEETYDVKFEFINNYICSDNYFDLLILYLDVNICNNKILAFKNIYQVTINILFESQKEIINFVKNNNKKKNNLPEFLEQFLRKHIKNYINKKTLVKVTHQLYQIYQQEKDNILFE